MFVGRAEELSRLRVLYQRNTPSLVVVKGRRRIGKSRLISEFSNRYGKGCFWNFSGLAPQEGISAQMQRDHFARQLSSRLKIPMMTFLDWGDALDTLSSYLKPGDIVFFDEISWMASKDPTFVPKLKAWWDLREGQIFLALCGSVSIWIEENILSSTALFGRINLVLTLEALSIPESMAFFRGKGMRLSHYDAYKLLGVLGGIPWYLEQLESSVSADENIKRLAFDKNGLLVKEFDRIFYDLFNGKGGTYKKILYALNDGAKMLSEIRGEVRIPKGGTLSRMMENLITAGFVQKEKRWSFKTGRLSKKSTYRINDPYMRFYLRMIEPHLSHIAENRFRDITISELPGFEIHLGMQIEYLLLQNKGLLLKKLGVPLLEIRSDGPYRQLPNSKQKGCQVDYLVETVTDSLYVCEFKFKRKELTMGIVREMEDRLEAIKAPRGFAKIPVLFHFGGVSDKVVLSSYFYRIVDISEFLQDEREKVDQ